MYRLRLGDYVKIRTGKLDANKSCENGKYPFFTCAIEPLKIEISRGICNRLAGDFNML